MPALTGLNPQHATGYLLHAINTLTTSPGTSIARGVKDYIEPEEAGIQR